MFRAAAARQLRRKPLAANRRPARFGVYCTMLKVIFVLGGLAVAALGGVAWVFSLGQRSVGYTLRLTVRNAAGQPLAGQPVVIWQPGYPSQSRQLDDAGQLSVLASESFGASALTGPSRPVAFAIRLQLPTVSPLYYWFEVARTGPLGTYHVYNDPYSATDRQWVGDFTAAGPVPRNPAAANASAQPVPPLGGTVVGWQGAAMLQRAGKAADGRRTYTLDLQLQQAAGQLGP